ncbi:MAG: DUF4837 family protein [Candidatus Latescibacterota bacterium]|jgi:hypothetical protein
MTNPKHFLPVLLACVAVTGYSGCSEWAIPPAGSYSDVLLVTEDGPASDWTRLVTPLVAKEIDYYTDTELEFKITPIKASEMDDYPAFKNILLCGELSSTTTVGQTIIDMIGNAGVDQVRNDGAAILKKQDRPVKNQFTLIVTAVDRESLADLIARRGGELAPNLEAGARERLRRHLLKRSKPELTQRLYNEFGFRVQIPSLYRMLSDEPKPPGVELIREPPTRILGVFWAQRDNPPTMGDKEELFDMRATYVWERYDKDQMDPERLVFEPARLGPYDCIRMSGYWYNDEEVLGGYYETYFIYDERVDLLWAVDLLVLAPGKPKHPLVRELRALAETFRIE